MSIILLVIAVVILLAMSPFVFGILALAFSLVSLVMMALAPIGRAIITGIGCVYVQIRSWFIKPKLVTLESLKQEADERIIAAAGGNVDMSASGPDEKVLLRRARAKKAGVRRHHRREKTGRL